MNVLEKNLSVALAIIGVSAGLGACAKAKGKAPADVPAPQAQTLDAKMMLKTPGVFDLVWTGTANQSFELKICTEQDISGASFDSCLPYLTANCTGASKACQVLDKNGQPISPASSFQAIHTAAAKGMDLYTLSSLIAGSPVDYNSGYQVVVHVKGDKDSKGWKVAQLTALSTPSTPRPNPSVSPQPDPSAPLADSSSGPSDPIPAPENSPAAQPLPNPSANAPMVSPSPEVSPEPSPVPSPIIPTPIL